MKRNMIGSAVSGIGTGILPGLPVKEALFEVGSRVRGFARGFIWGSVFSAETCFFVGAGMRDMGGDIAAAWDSATN